MEQERTNTKGGRRLSFDFPYNRPGALTVHLLSKPIWPEADGVRLRIRQQLRCCAIVGSHGHIRVRKLCEEVSVTQLAQITANFLSHC